MDGFKKEQIETEKVLIEVPKQLELNEGDIHQLLKEGPKSLKQL